MSANFGNFTYPYKILPYRGKKNDIHPKLVKMQDKVLSYHLNKKYSCFMMKIMFYYDFPVGVHMDPPQTTTGGKKPRPLRVK